MIEAPTEQEQVLMRAYPAPPSISWVALLCVQFILVVVACDFAPMRFWNLIGSLVLDSWMLYLCVWVRKLNPRFMSMIWCLAFLALQVAFAVPGAPLTGGKDITILATSLVFLDLLLWIVTIFVVRAELHYHYNTQEPIGLYLSGTMTFFFSYFYFQYHLRKIAQLKIANAGRPFLYLPKPPAA